MIDPVKITLEERRPAATDTAGRFSSLWEGPVAAGYARGRSHANPAEISIFHLFRRHRPTSRTTRVSSATPAWMSCAFLRSNSRAEDHQNGEFHRGWRRRR